MNLEIHDTMVPGTRLTRAAAGNVTGRDFLDRVFFPSDGVMLSRIRDVSGIDGSTLQNWIKRGWVENAPLKRYTVDQVAHILIINMLRSCVQLIISRSSCITSTAEWTTGATILSAIPFCTITSARYWIA